LMLPAVKVRGRTGDNVIVGEDAPGPVRVEVALYSGASSPQLMTLYWGALANPVATYQVTPGDTPGITVAFEVPWDAIIAVGSDPALPVCYTVSNGVNLQQSPETLCRVDIAVQDATLPLPRYPQPPSYQSPPRWDERIANYNCSARAWAGITLYIPADARLVDGSRMVVHWKGYAGRNLSSPIDGLEADFELRLDATAATQGVTFVIGPEHFQRLVLPLSYRGIDDVGQGSADAWYTLYRPGLPAIYNLHPENYCTVDLIRPGSICPCTRDDYLSDPPDWCEECDPLVEANCPPAH
ncbi:hypothetical protein, partial [Pseudomonas sp.]|uniref:hypothetical protein n=1 Tax=Pseudomonas sp. TaxID=306 RepID=UPI003CC679F2